MPCTPETALGLKKPNALYQKKDQSNTLDRTKQQAVDELALWIWHWSFSKPYLHFLNSNTEAATSTQP